MKLSNKSSAQHAFKELVLLKQKRPDGRLKNEEILLFNDYISVIHTCLQFNVQISGEDKYKIIAKSISDAAKGLSHSFQDFITNVTQQERAYLQSPRFTYFLVSTVSIPRASAYSYFRRFLGTSTINICANKPHFVGPCSWFLNGVGKVNSLEPSENACVYAKTKARTENEAAENALNDIQITLAIINFGLNYLNRPLIEFGISKPINRIRIGPYQTLHNYRGRPYKDKIWYEIGGQTAQKPADPDVWNQTTRDAFDQIFKKLKKHKLHSLLVRAFLAYNAALNDTDRNTSIAKLWRVLEVLTCTSKMDDVINRASMFSKERDTRILFLKNAQHVRNVIIHEDSTHELASDIVINLRNYIEMIISFYVFENLPVRNQRELEKLLVGPYTTKEIESEIRRLYKVKKLVP